MLEPSKRPTEPPVVVIKDRKGDEAMGFEDQRPHTTAKHDKKRVVESKGVAGVTVAVMPSAASDSAPVTQTLRGAAKHHVELYRWLANL